MSQLRVAVIGAGIGGLAAAIDLARQGAEVTLLERQGEPGGKMREIVLGEARIDAGPTVFTLRSVFDELFAAAGDSFADRVALRPATTLARHAWGPDRRLDLYADVERSQEAIGEFAGAAEARRFRDFCAATRRMFQTLEAPYLRSSAPSPIGLVRAMGLRGLPNLFQIRPFATMWGALGDHFFDARLRQLFGRYATYCGSSPFLSPATLMLVAHVEQQGVWLVTGGMRRIADALAALAERVGVRLCYRAEANGITLNDNGVAGVRLASGEHVTADAIVMNADAAALAGGFLGGGSLAEAVPAMRPHQRSLSAMTWALLAKTSGFPLSRHTVFFSDDYAMEFDELVRQRRIPADPTVYVCAQDRSDDGRWNQNAERLLVLVNAPATGDSNDLNPAEIMQCEERTFRRLERCGLQVSRQPETTLVTTPQHFEAMFPGTGGALYGRATHGWRSSFQRPGPRTRIPGLYLAGGSAHPGAGVPMVALSGRMAASALLADHASIGRSKTVAMPGGTSTR